MAFLALGLFWGVFAAQVPVLKAALEASDRVFGTVLLGSALGLLTAMWLAPRADARFAARSMQVAAVALACAMLLPPLAAAPLVFFCVMVLVGASSGLLDVLMNARVSDLEVATGKSLMNANHGMFSVGYAIGAVLTGLAREGGVPTFLTFAACSVMLLVLAGQLRMVPGGQGEASPVGASSPLWPVALCGAVTLVAFMSEATVEAWSALHIERTLQGGAAEGALGPATLGLTMAFGRFSGQLVAERLREWQVIMVASLVSACGALIAATADSPAMAYLGFGTLGLGVSVIGPMGLALAGKLVRPEQRTKTISRVAVIAFSGFFFAPVLMGWSSEIWGLRVSFAGVAALLLMAIPLAMALRALQARRRLIADPV